MDGCRVNISWRTRGWLLGKALLYVTVSLQVGLARRQGECQLNNVCQDGLCFSSSSYCGLGDVYCGEGCKGTTADYCRSGCQSGAYGNAFQSSAEGKALSTGPIGGLAAASVLWMILLLGVGIGRRAPGWPLTLALMCVAASMQVDWARADGECPLDNTCQNGPSSSPMSYSPPSPPSNPSAEGLLSSSPTSSPASNSPSSNPSPIIVNIPSSSPTSNPSPVIVNIPSSGPTSSPASSPASNSPSSNPSPSNGIIPSSSPTSSPTSSPASNSPPSNPSPSNGIRPSSSPTSSPASNSPSSNSSPSNGISPSSSPTSSPTSNSPLSNRRAGKHSSTSTGTIVGIAAGAAIGGILLWAVVCVACRRKQSKRRGTLEVVHDDPLSIVSGQDGLRIRRLSYPEVSKATGDFRNFLGRGGFGVVYKGVLEDGTEIAVKQLADIEGDAKGFEAEVKTLGSINHNNLVTLLGYTIDPNGLFLIYEFVEKGSLDQWIFVRNVANVDSVLPWSTRVDILTGTARALAYLHTNLQRGRAIIHLDIKPENILLDESYSPKLADFGLAKLVGSKTARKTYPAGGTKGYMAPEVSFDMPATSKMDVYSFGMLMLVVISGREPVDPSAPPDSIFLPALAIRKVCSGEQLDVVDPLLVKYDQIDANLATKLISMAMLCLQRDPHDRPDMSSVLRMMEGSAVSHYLPPTLRSDLELTERIIRGKPDDTSKSTEPSDGKPDDTSKSTEPSDSTRDERPML